MKALQPTLIVVAGPNGSGKTSLTDKVLQYQWIEGCEYINPDAIAQNEFGNWNSPDAVLKAANLAAQKRELCIAEKRSLAFETVLSAQDKVDFVYRAKQQGYFIRVFFVGTDHPAINAARVTRRVMEGGHEVPIPKIISRYTKSIANCTVLAAVADRTYVYDNSVDDATPRLMFKTRNGELTKVYSKINPWASVIAEAVPHRLAKGKI